MISLPLTISLNDLLAGLKVESDRLECKQGWNPIAILRTVCAFANDFQNFGGGYVLVGIAEVDGVLQLPPIGVPETDLDAIQKDLLRYGNLIQPPYFPVFGVEVREGRNVVILWCPGGQNRPCKAPEDVTAKEKKYRFCIRHYSNSVVAKDSELRDLMSLTATVPFDDRISHQSSIEDIQTRLVRAFLKEIKSGLYPKFTRMDFVELCQRMDLVSGSPEYLRPRNVGLMFFNESPEKFFPGTQIDLVQFPDGVGGSNLIEQTFRGPLPTQIRDCLAALRNRVLRERITKLPDRAESVRVWNYPYAALEEAVVNAIYHRAYDQREPVEVRVNPDCIEIISYPGPDPSIRREQLAGDRIVARRYRNRRIGEMLKELELTEGRSTGIPKIRDAMRGNTSPQPTFETDDERTYFLVRLPIHPAFLVAHDEAHDEAHDLNETEQRILLALRGGPKNKTDLRQVAGFQSISGAVKKALERLHLDGLIVFTIPDRPRSKHQQRRLTARGEAVAERLAKPP